MVQQRVEHQRVLAEGLIAPHRVDGEEHGVSVTDRDVVPEDLFLEPIEAEELEAADGKLTDDFGIARR